MVESRTILKSVTPNLALTSAKNGSALRTNVFQVASTFGSNRISLAIKEIPLLTKINNLLTLIRSKALFVACRVFCPKITSPSDGNEAIGLIFASYKRSLSSALNL